MTNGSKIVFKIVRFFIETTPYYSLIANPRHCASAPVAAARAIRTDAHPISAFISASKIRPSMTIRAENNRSGNVRYWHKADMPLHAIKK
jgi:hypothetical protein